MFNREDVYIEHVVLKELHDTRCLLIEAIYLRDDRVGSQPSMRSKLTLFRTRVGQLQILALHMASLAGRNGILHIERQGRLLGERGVLPLIVEKDGTLPFV